MIFYRDLSDIPLADLESRKFPCEATAWGLARATKHKDFDAFLSLYADRVRAVDDASRLALMRASNPRYVLRNWMAQRAIEAADKDNDFSEVKKLLRVLKRPFQVQGEAEAAGYASPPPNWSKSIKVSCSS